MRIYDHTEYRIRVDIIHRDMYVMEDGTVRPGRRWRWKRMLSRMSNRLATMDIAVAHFDDISRYVDDTIGE